VPEDHSKVDVESWRTKSFVLVWYEVVVKQGTDSNAMKQNTRSNAKGRSGIIMTPFEIEGSGQKFTLHPV
jgi:hypothetical protein